MAIGQAASVIDSVAVDRQRDYEESALRILRQWDIVLDQLKLKSRSGRPDSRACCLKSLKKLERQRATVLARLQGLRGAKDTWDSVRFDVDSALLDLQLAIERAQTGDH